MSAEDESLFRWTTAGLHAAGADTTVSAHASFYLIMTLRPDIQAKAKEELDRVVGTHRLPTFSDRDQLPYLEGLIQEVHRWNPVANLSIPHRLQEVRLYTALQINAQFSSSGYGL